MNIITWLASKFKKRKTRVFEKSTIQPLDESVEGRSFHAYIPQPPVETLGQSVDPNAQIASDLDESFDSRDR